MKGKLIIITLLITGLLTSCSTNTGNSPTSFEQQFLGTWYLKRKTVNYDPNTNQGIQITTSTDTAHCKIKFTGDPCSSEYFHCDDGLTDCNLTPQCWNAISPYINSSAEYEVINQTNTSLTLKNYLQYNYLKITQLEKNFSDLYTTCDFTYSTEGFRWGLK